MLLSFIITATLLAGAPGQEVLHEEQIAPLECPRPAALGDRQRDALAHRLTGPLTEQTGPDDLRAVARLFLDHGFTVDETVNQLVSAYCPVIVRASGLNDYEKAGKVRAFAATAYDITSALAPAPDPNRW